MNKILQICGLAGLLALFLMGCQTVTDVEAVTETEETELNAELDEEGVIGKVALLTDQVGESRMESGDTFCKAIWTGIESYCTVGNVESACYSPKEDTKDSRLELIEDAVTDGYNVLVLAGSHYGEALVAAQSTYPDVTFIAVDVDSYDMTFDGETFYDPAMNTTCITFAEEQSGFLAGYAAVMEGYTRLGYLGQADTSVAQKYGFGYLQGIAQAAETLGVKVSVEYHYADINGDQNQLKDKLENWYAEGCQVIFVSEENLEKSAFEAATQMQGLLIGTDQERFREGADFAWDPYLTAVTKELDVVVEQVVKDLFCYAWDEYSCNVVCFSLSEGTILERLQKKFVTGDYLGLAAEDEWRFNTFDREQYAAMIEGIKAGDIHIEDDPEVEIESFATDHMEIIQE
ncbi:MAG: BMP family ABC transporter substrate-binding protein [Lachnospiraceae bacterium]|nr:BMP family ABC transporter substrate-binding protein [Lachnospiraceae bacterium]